MAKLAEKLTQLADRKRLWLTVAIVMVVLQLRWWWQPGKDAGAYLSIAHSLAHHRGVMHHGEPSVWYLPGYPALIAPAFWTGERPFLLISLINTALTLAAMAGVYQWFKRFGGAIASLAALLTAAVMCNDSVLDYTRTTLSESSFFPALIWSAVLLQRLLVERDGRRSIILCVLAAVLVSYLVIVRQLGIFVLGGYGMAGLWLAVHHRLSWPRLILTCAALALPAGVVMFAWSMHQKDVAAAQHLPSHFGYIKLAPADILEAVRMRVTEIGRLIVPGMHKAGAPAGRWLHPNTLLLFPVGLFMLVQWARTVRTVGVDVLLLTWPFYLLFLCTWPYDQSTRYAMPFLPVFVLAVCVMLELIRVRQTIVVLFTLATLLTGLIGWASEVPKSWRENRSWADVDAIVAEITDRSAPIAATEPRAHAQRVAFTIQKAIPIIDPRKDEVTSRWFILDPKLAAPAGYTPRVTTKTMTLAERSK